LIVTCRAAAEVFHLGRHAQALILELLDFGESRLQSDRFPVHCQASAAAVQPPASRLRGLRLIIFAALAFIAHGVDVLSVVMSV
jgi:hypothetical protein